MFWLTACAPEGDLLNKGDALERSGKPVEALAAYGKAIEIDPSWWTPYYRKGLLLKELGRTDEAISALEMAWARRPSLHDVPLVLAATLAERGRTEDALRVLREARTIWPQDDEIQQAIERIRGHSNEGVR